MTTANKQIEYTRYAEHCLALVKISPDHESRIILREMAAEWLRLADDLPSDKPRLGL
jgi:hypothetical protein